MKITASIVPNSPNKTKTPQRTIPPILPKISSTYPGRKIVID